MMNCWSSCFADGDVVVAVGGGEVAGAGVEAARGEAGAGEFDEGLVLADGEGVGIGGDVADELAACRAVGGEGEDGFDFSVFGEGFGGVESDGGAGGVEFVGSLLRAGEGAGYIVGVAEEEVGGVDEDGAVGVFGFDFEAVRGRTRGRIGGRRGVRRGRWRWSGSAGWVRRGGLWGQCAGSGRAGRGRSGRGRGRGRWSRCRRGGSGCRGCRVVEVGDLEVEFAGLGVPVERQIAVDVLHAGGFGGDGLGAKRWTRETAKQGQGKMFGHASFLAHVGAGENRPLERVKGG